MNTGLFSMLAGTAKSLATATPTQRMVAQASLMNLQLNLSRWPGLVRDISMLFGDLTDEAQAEVTRTISLAMDDDDFTHLQHILDDYRV
jgi:hypothetical protein